MSVPVQDTVFEYTANGATTVFPYECYVIVATDLKVYADDVEVTSGFTVTDVGNQDGGNVVFAVAPADGTKIRIERIVEVKRDTDYQENGDFLADTVNKDFDRIWMALQRVGYLLGLDPGQIGRALLLGPDDTDGAGSYRARQNRIQDLGDPTGDQDAVNLRTLEQRILEALTDGSGNPILELLANNTDPTKGAALIGYDGTTVKGALEALAGLFDDLAVADDPAKGAALIGFEDTTVSAYLRGQTSRVVSSIAELKQVDSSKFPHVFVTGYYGALDGGGGQYICDQSDTTTADDGGLVIVGNDGGRWKLQVTGSIFAETYGAKNDGVTDNTVALQKAIDAMNRIGGGVINFRAGVYMTGLLEPKTNVSFRGVAIDHTGHPGVATPGSCIKLKNGANSALFYIRLLQRSIKFFDLTLDGNKANNASGGSVIDFETCAPADINTYSEDSYVVIERCTIWEGKQNGVNVTPPHRAVRIINSYIANNGGDGARIETSDCLIDATLFGLNGGDNIHLVGAEVTHLSNLDLFWSQSGINIDASMFFGSPMPCKAVFISNCGIDRAAGAGLNTSNHAHSGISITNSRFNGNSSSGVGSAPHVNITANCLPVTISGTVFDDSVFSPVRPTYDIQVAGSAVVFVSGNIHTGAHTIGVTNTPGQLRQIGSNAAYYIDNNGLASINRLTAVQTAGTLSSLVRNTTATENSLILDVDNGTAFSASFRTANGAGYNSAQTAVYVGRNSATSRSINAGGTVNASGADYAEYEFKRDDCGVLAKGQIVGFDLMGRLTDKWEYAITFGVKSTDPSLVGGDSWGAHLIEPKKPEPDADGAISPEAMAEFEAALEKWRTDLEAARARVDRIAYCGKVPVNVFGAIPGDWIVPIEVDGGIGALVVKDADLTPEQHRMAVGRVRRILEDGRAEISVSAT